jgi:autotransporter-associated beta strand protein
LADTNWASSTGDTSSGGTVDTSGSGTGCVNLGASTLGTWELSRYGDGSLVLAGSNTYTGGTIVVSGGWVRSP